MARLPFDRNIRFACLRNQFEVDKLDRMVCVHPNTERCLRLKDFDLSFMKLNLLTSMIGRVSHLPAPPSQSGFATLPIFTVGTHSAVVAPFVFQLDGNNNCLNCDVIDDGSLQSAPVVTPSMPEPSSVVLMLAGLGFLVVVMPKRLAQGHQNAT